MSAGENAGLNAISQDIQNLDNFLTDIGPDGDVDGTRHLGGQDFSGDIGKAEQLLRVSIATTNVQTGISLKSEITGLISKLAAKMGQSTLGR